MPVEVRERMNKLDQDAENMQEVMSRTAQRSDIWQDRCVYAMAKAIYHILEWIHRESRKS